MCRSAGSQPSKSRDIEAAHVVAGCALLNRSNAAPAATLRANRSLPGPTHRNGKQVSASAPMPQRVRDQILNRLLRDISLPS